MIVRTWRAEATVNNVVKYRMHFENNVYPQLSHIIGFKNAQVMQREKGQLIEIIVQTFWESMDDVKKFAGANPHVAVVEQEAKDILLRYDSTVEHYTLVFS